MIFNMKVRNFLQLFFENCRFQFQIIILQMTQNRKVVTSLSFYDLSFSDNHIIPTFFFEIRYLKPKKIVTLICCYYYLFTNKINI